MLGGMTEEEMAHQLKSDVVKCAHKDCAQTYADHRWGKIKASAEGWFFPKRGDATCPAHNPPWVVTWRKAR